MAEPIGALRVELSANAAQFEKDMGRARKAALRTSTSMSGSFKKFGASVATAIKQVFSLRNALIGVAAAAAIGFFIKRQIEAADALAKTADKVGVGVEALQEYRFAADLAGVANNTLDMALQRASRRIGEAAKGTGELKDTLIQYGIAVRDSAGQTRRTEDVLLDLADAIKNAESDSERLRIAFKAFDSEGAALVNLFKLGAEGVRKLRQEARDLGIVLDESMVREAEKLNDQFTKMGAILNTQVTRAVIALAPQIIQLGRAFAEAAPHIARFVGSLLPDQFAPIEILQERLESLRQTALKLQVFNELGKGGVVAGELERVETQIRDIEALIQRREEENALLEVALSDAGSVSDEQAEKVEKIITGLQHEIDQLHRTENGQKLYNLAKSAGVEVTEEFTKKVLPLIAALDKEKEAQDAAKKAAEDRGARVKAILSEVETAQERYNRKLEELNELKPHLGQEAYARAVAAAKKELDDSNEAAKRQIDLVKDIGATFSSSFEEAVLAGGKLSDVLQGLADDLLKIALRQLVLQPILGAATDFFKGITSPTSPDAQVPGIGDSFFGFDGFARGGRHGGGFRLVGERGPELEATGPSRIFNARETQEILSGDGMTGGNMEVNIYAPPGSKVETQESQGPGGRQLDVIIDEATAKNINTPGSRTARAMQTRFPINPRLAGR